MPFIRYMCCLLVFFTFLPVTALSDPLCAPAGSVMEIPGNPLHGWLSKMDPDQARAYVEGLARGDSPRWEDDTLIIKCRIEDEEPVDISAARVEGVAADTPDGSFNEDYFDGLAGRTGHSKQEADILYRKYSQLEGAFYRQVPDGDGGMINESDAIFNRYKRDIDTSGVVQSAGGEQARQKQAEELQKKVLAAQARGDMNEMMKLAGEIQRMNAPVMEQVNKLNQDADRQQWQMLEDAYGELAQAAYRSRITIYSGACLQCAQND